MKVNIDDNMDSIRKMWERKHSIASWVSLFVLDILFAQNEYEFIFERRHSPSKKLKQIQSNRIKGIEFDKKKIIKHCAKSHKYKREKI